MLYLKGNKTYKQVYNEKQKSKNYTQELDTMHDRSFQSWQIQWPLSLHHNS